MPRTDLTTQDITLSGLTLALDPAEADGNMFVNFGVEVFQVVNSGVGAVTINIITPRVVAPDLEIEDPAISVLPGTTVLIGPFNMRDFNQRVAPDKGKVYVNYAGDVTNVEVAVLSPSP